MLPFFKNENTKKNKKYLDRNDQNEKEENNRLK
jgi:hypothetical protein